jgi:hypothetical protein
VPFQAPKITQFWLFKAPKNSKKVLPYLRHLKTPKRCCLRHLKQLKSVRDSLWNLGTPAGLVGEAPRILSSPTSLYLDRLPQCPSCSSYHTCLAHRRSPVRSRARTPSPPSPSYSSAPPSYLSTSPSVHDGHLEAGWPARGHYQTIARPPQYSNAGPSYSPTRPSYSPTSPPSSSPLPLDVQYDDVLSVINYMNHGEVHVAKRDLMSFLNLAGKLGVAGFTPAIAKLP